MFLVREQIPKDNERAKRVSFVFYSGGLLLILVDQAVKYFVFKTLVFQRLFFSDFGLEQLKNYRFAFSLNLPVWLMYFIYATVIFFMTKYVSGHWREFRLQTFFAWTLIFAGALSNIGERIVLGYVRDFIFIFGGVFNLADMYIILGVGILLIDYQALNSKL